MPEVIVWYDKQDARDVVAIANPPVAFAVRCVYKVRAMAAVTIYGGEVRENSRPRRRGPARL